ncbi:MAG: hypothetical protein ABI625_07825 [bacterium]
MEIKPRNISVAPPAKVVEKTGGSPAQPASPPVKSDAVQISDAGRALAARGRDDSALSPERTAQIRQRVLDGAYNSLSVIDHVARRILVSGDLG